MARNRTSWTTQEYLSQDENYFSESAQDLIPIEEMAPQYALNAYRKLLREFGCEVASTNLACALAKRITPETTDLRVMLTEHGKARIVPAGLTTSGARSRLRRAGADHTHREGDWVVGEKDTDMVVSVRKVKH